VAGQLSTLAFCAIAPSRPFAAATAAGWCNRLLRLGVGLPLFLVHDVGWLLAAPADALRRRTAQGVESVGAGTLLTGYKDLLQRLADSPVVEATAGMRLRDEIIAVLLARSFGQISVRYQRQAPTMFLDPLPLEPAFYEKPPPGGALGDAALQFLRFLLEPAQALHLLTAIELIDVHLLRLLSAGGTMQREATLDSDSQSPVDAADRIDLVDLLQAISAPELRDVARFSLDLLPSVLETRRSAGSQHYPVGGYAAIERRGPLDAVLLHELASDDEVFFLRLSENELLYHGRERRLEEGRGEHHILVDASASMHGLRQVFARGLAIALAQKLLLLGARVVVRFFDGRLHEPVVLLPNPPNLGTALPYLLSFRSSRGRHYGRVFSDLLRELQGHRQPTPARGPSSGGHKSAGPAGYEVQAVHILTHGECHVAAATMAGLARLVDLHGVFILPSSDLALDYLPLLRSSAIITDEDLRQPEARARRALGLVAAAGKTVASPSAKKREEELSGGGGGGRGR
jgi:hypothetical protein